MAGRGAAAPAATALTLPGTNGNYASTPSAAANQITGDIDIRVKLSMASWDGTASDQALMSKYGSSGNRSYYFSRGTSGTLNLIWYDAGNSFHSIPADAATGYTNNTVHWVRVTLDVDPGTVTFYKSDDGSSWTMVGTAQSAGGITTIKSTTTTLEVGGFTGGFSPLNGTVHRAELRSGIGGSIAQLYDPSAVVILGTRNPTTLVASTGETWTMNGSAWDWATV